MGLLDRIFGRRAADHGSEPDHRPGQDRPRPHDPAPATYDGRSPDQRAVERYRYLLPTAPPDQLEEAHAEAFAQLTLDQRQQVLAQLAAAVPSSERPRADDPRTLARAATRAEVRRPGTLERAFGGPGSGHGAGPGYARGGYGGPGFGSMVGASLLGTVGGLVVGTAVADALVDSGAGDGGLFGGGDEAGGDPGHGDGGDGGDLGYADGGDGGDGAGGDFGGGDFGGGEF